MGKVVAIGGGFVGSYSRMLIDERIVELTGKSNPKGLIIPTATYDSQYKFNSFDNIYGTILGCETDVLYLISEDYTEEEIQDKILSADFIYVSGGNTLNMMRIWRKYGVDKLIVQAYEKGTVLSGSSAGCICWFLGGHSDSLSYEGGYGSWNYIMVRCLGLIKAVCCPHYHGERRENSFLRMMKGYVDTAFAIDDDTAIQFVDNDYEVISNSEWGRAYKMKNHDGEIITEELIHGYKYRLNPIKE